MYTDVMYHTWELTTYGKLFFTLVVKIIYTCEISQFDHVEVYF